MQESGLSSSESSVKKNIERKKIRKLRSQLELNVSVDRREMHAEACDVAKAGN